MSTTHQQANEFEELYLKQKRKSSILLATAIVLGFTTGGSLIWGASQQAETQGMRGGAPSQGFGSQSGGPGMGIDIKSFFNDDGSVDEDRIDELTSRMPSGAGSQFKDMIKQQADQAVEDGDITQEQADALSEKIDTATESSDASE